MGAGFGPASPGTAGGLVGATYTGTLYAAPFAAAANLQVRAVAWNPSLMPSPQLSAIIT